MAHDQRQAGESEPLTFAPASRPSRSSVRPRRDDAFASYHPALCLAFFTGALVLGMCLRHPVYQAIGLVCATGYYLILRGRSAGRLFRWIVPLCVLVTAVNPLFDPLGATVLFTWWAGRPYTLEALYAGFSAGVMVATVLLWFGCANIVMTSDKVLAVFGGAAPSIALVVTMTLRLVPRFQARLRDIAAAWRGLGFDGRPARRTDRLRQSGAMLAALSGWALERSVIGADSLRARGFGLPGRTTFARYRFTRRDAVLLTVLTVLAAITITALAQGTAQVDFVPVFRMSPVTGSAVVGYASYAAFLAAPAVIDIREAAIWRSSLSRI